MKIDSIQDGYPAPLRDELFSIRDQGYKRYRSVWTRVEAGATGTFNHLLKDVPHVVDVLEATSSQGEGMASASSVTVGKTDTVVTVQNGGTSRFFMVRAF